MKEIKVSAKTIGAINMPYFCPRCYWIQLHCRLPYQIFPGIFSSLDSYNKKIIHAHLDKHEALPSWLAELGDVTGYENPPHWSKYNIFDDETGIVLQGEADAIFKMGDGSHMIADYKTAKFTGSQDKLFPIYEAQLNAYAYIGERRGFKPITKLALIYFQPNTTEEVAKRDGVIIPEGFLMEFTPHVLEVELKPDIIVPPLLQKTRDIHDAAPMPKGARGCKNCELLAEMLKTCDL